VKADESHRAFCNIKVTSKHEILRLLLFVMKAIYLQVQIATGASLMCSK